MNNDKKKMIMLAGLGLVLVAVGAFQFIPKKSSTPSLATTEPTAAAKAAPGGPQSKDPAKDGEKKDPQREELIAMIQPLSARDPFAPQTPALDTEPTGPLVPQQTPVQPPVVTKPVRGGGAHRPAPIPGDALPFDPTQGGGTLPQVGDNHTGVGISDGKPLRQPGDLAYEVKGVLVGDKPMAVFEDDSGNQRLVPLGGSLDRDSKVVGIEKGKVRIRHKGKDKTLRLPEGP